MLSRLARSLLPACVLSAVLAGGAGEVPAGWAAPASQAGSPGTQAPAIADRCDAATPQEPVRVLVTTILPQVPTAPDEQLVVRGYLVNCGPQQVSDLAVRLAVGNRISRRSGLALADRERQVGAHRLPPTEADDRTLAPGARTTFATTTTVADLRLGTRNGVFPLAVQARARLPDAGRTQVGLATTFLPWLPDGPIAPTRVAWLVPLVDQPRRGPREVMLDDELDRLVADEPGSRGRLHRTLLAAADGSRTGEVPMTYAVDPDLLFSLKAMTRPYTVRARGREVRRRDSQRAFRWLTALADQAQGRGAGGVSQRPADIVALPFADPDVAALARSSTGLRDDVELLRKLGATETERVLGVLPLSSVALPPPGPVAAAVEPLAGDPSSPTALVLDAGAFSPLDPSTSRTPSAPTTLASPVSGKVRGLVTDPALSTLVEPEPGSPTWQGERLALQRWIAELATLTAERPSESRTIVVAPRRRADLVPSVASGAISATNTLPFACAVPLRDVAAGRERCPDRGGVRAPDSQPPAQVENRGTPLSRTDGPSTRRRRDLDPRVDRMPLSQSYVSGLSAVRRSSDQFTDEVLLSGSPESTRTKARLLRARGRAESSAWRDDLQGGRELVTLLRADVDDLRGKIVLRGAPVLLTGRSGVVRVSVVNALDQPVNIGVQLKETAAARLVSNDIAVAEVPARSARQVDIRVTARTSGRFVAQAVLVGRDGRPFGQRVPLQVTSSGYGSVAVGVTGVAAAVLFVTVGVRLIRRVRGRAKVRA